jgi:hypothetical protein
MIRNDRIGEMAKLVLSIDELFLQDIPLTRERLTIGRKPHNDICLEWPTISGDHAVIVTLLGDSFLEDLGSTNGTRVNGLPVDKHVLADQDRIDIGRFHFLYCQEAGAVSAAAPDYQPDAAVPALLRVLSGAGSGRELPLIKATTTLGRAGQQVAEISRHEAGFVLQHREGEQRPAVNGQTIGQQPFALTAGDVLEIAGVKMELVVKA